MDYTTMTKDQPDNTTREIEECGDCGRHGKVEDYGDKKIIIHEGEISPSGYNREVKDSCQI